MKEALITFLTLLFTDAPHGTDALLIVLLILSVAACVIITLPSLLAYKGNRSLSIALGQLAEAVRSNEETNKQLIEDLKQRNQQAFELAQALKEQGDKNTDYMMSIDRSLLTLANRNG